MIISDYTRDGLTGSCVVAADVEGYNLSVCGIAYDWIKEEEGEDPIYQPTTELGWRVGSGVVDLDFSQFAPDFPDEVPVFVFAIALDGSAFQGMSDNTLGPLPLSSSSKPFTPVLSNFTRTGATGSIQVSDVKETETTRVYGFDLMDNIEFPYMPVRRVELGSRSGEGAIDLDFSEMFTDPTSWPCAPIFAITEDALGNKSDMSDLVDVSIGGDFPFTLESVVRTGPTTGIMTITGADADTLLVALWWMNDKQLKNGYRVGSGEIVLDPLEQNCPHGFTVLAVSSKGEWRFNGIVESPLTSANPSIIPRRKPEIVRK